MSHVAKLRRVKLIDVNKKDTTSDYASPGFATWRQGLIGICCHFGVFFAFFPLFLIFGQFVITPYSNIF